MGEKREVFQKIIAAGTMHLANSLNTIAAIWSICTIMHTHTLLGTVEFG